jgi:hypothetical protein
MIQYGPDGMTIFYVDANGQKISRIYTEGAAYNDLVAIRDAQLQADKENLQNQASYNQTLANAQTNVDASPGAAITPPKKPLMKAISDTGVPSYGPFVPPLADLVMPQVAEGTIHGMIGTATTLPPDRNAIMQNQVDLMFRKMFPPAA